MSRMRKVPLVTAVVLLIMAMLFGCSLMLKDVAGKEESYVRLNIGNPAAGKAISVGEYEVTEVYIEPKIPLNSYNYVCQ